MQFIILVFVMQVFEFRFLFLGIVVDVFVDEFKFIFESNFNIGKVSVSCVGICVLFNWIVEWVIIGGDQLIIIVNGIGLIGNNVLMKVVIIDDGGMFFRLILGDML